VARFAQIALGSLYELDTLLQIGAELNFADPEHIFCLREKLSVLARQISSFIKKRRERVSPTTYLPPPTSCYPES
jgi:four helix bundle protein